MKHNSVNQSCAFFPCQVMFWRVSGRRGHLLRAVRIKTRAKGNYIHRGFRVTKGYLHFGHFEKIDIKDFLLHCAHTDSQTIFLVVFNCRTLHQWGLLLVGSWCSKDNFDTKTSFWPKMQTALCCTDPSIC